MPGKPSLIHGRCVNTRQGCSGGLGGGQGPESGTGGGFKLQLGVRWEEILSKSTHLVNLEASGW